MKLQPHDPLNVPAQLSVIKQAKREIIEGDLKLEDGKIIQADRESIEALLLASNGVEDEETIHWRLADNSTIELDILGLINLHDDIMIAKAKRMMTVDAEYLALKTQAPTLRRLEEWKAQHRV